MAILLVFTVFMTFVSLTVASLMSYFLNGRGTVLDVIIPIVLTVVATGFSAVVFTQVED